MAAHDPDTGFFGALFDFSFASFITARLIRVLYALGLALAALFTVMTLIAGFSQGFGRGLLMLILAPLLFLLGAMYMRVVLEVLMVIFRIAENVERIAHRPSSPGT